uniref:uncharacterized protein n=1 Tax=Centroberyx gerrardi TaxID=166262 RepID=UPI003AB0B203
MEKREETSVEAVQRPTLTDQTRGDATWDEYLMPAPRSITILTELVVTCSSRDFSINKNKPKDGYRVLRNPDSLHACLLQVCNSGWEAFNKAHSSMDQIRLHSAVTPEYLREVLEILSKDGSGSVWSFLPPRMERISDTSEECLSLARSTREKFSEFISLMQELLQASVNSRNCYAEEVEKIKKKIEKSKLRIKSAAEAKAKAEKAVQDLQRPADKGHRNFSRAAALSPVPVESLSSSVVGSVFAGIVSFANFLTRPFPNKSKPAMRKEASDTTDPIAPLKIYSKSGELLDHKQRRMDWVDEEKWDAISRIKHRRAELAEAVERFDKTLAKQEIELNDNLDLNSSINTAVELLKQGMDALGQVREQWNEMVLFFQMVLDVMNPWSEEEEPRSEEARMLRHFRTHKSGGRLHTLVRKALETSILINRMSGVYTEVSSRYLMDSVSRLARLLTMDPRKTDFLREKEALLESCQEAQRAVADLLQKKKKELRVESELDRNEELKAD